MDEERHAAAEAHWLVRTHRSTYTVSRTMAVHVERELMQRRPPAWITIVDIAGARMRVRAATIVATEQDTAELRATWRRFWAERDREEDRDWTV